MIDFACEKIKLEDLFRCTFQLSKTEYRLLELLLERNEWTEIKVLSKELKRERSTIHKSLKNLIDQDLVIRRKMNRDKGGYLYVYRAIDKEEIKKKVKEIIETWSTKAKESLENW